MANMLYVDSSWSSCSAGDPVIVGDNILTFGTDAFADIQSAVNAASASEATTINVYAGTYADNIYFLDSKTGGQKADIAIQAADGVAKADVIISGSIQIGKRGSESWGGIDSSVTVVEKWDSDVTIQGVTLSGANVIADYCEDVNIANCVVDGANVKFSYAVPTVTNSDFKNNAYIQTKGTSSGDLTVSGGSFTDSRINITSASTSGSAKEAVIENVTFNCTIPADQAANKSFYAIRSKGDTVVVQSCEFNVDSELADSSASPTEAGDWSVLRMRTETSTLPWTIEDCTVNFSEAAANLEGLNFITNDSTSANAANIMNVTNLTATTYDDEGNQLTGDAAVAALAGGSEGFVKVDGEVYDDGTVVSLSTIYINSAWDGSTIKIADGIVYGVNAFNNIDAVFALYGDKDHINTETTTVKFLSDVTAAATGKKYLYSDVNVLFTAEAGVTVDMTTYDRAYLMGYYPITNYQGAPTDVPTFTIDDNVTFVAKLVEAGQVVDSGDVDDQGNATRDPGAANILVNGKIAAKQTNARPYSTISTGTNGVITTHPTLGGSEMVIRSKGEIDINGDGSFTTVQFSPSYLSNQGGTLKLTNAKGITGTLIMYNAKSDLESIATNAQIVLDNSKLYSYTSSSFAFAVSASTRDTNVTLTLKNGSELSGINKTTQETGLGMSGTNKGTINVEGASKLVLGTVTNTGTINVTGNGNTVTATTLSGDGTVVFKDAALDNKISLAGSQGKVRFLGTTSIADPNLALAANFYVGTYGLDAADAEDSELTINGDVTFNGITYVGADNEGATGKKATLDIAEGKTLTVTQLYARASSQITVNAGSKLLSGYGNLQGTLTVDGGVAKFTSVGVKYDMSVSATNGGVIDLGYTENQNRHHTYSLSNNSILTVGNLYETDLAITMDSSSTLALAPQASQVAEGTKLAVTISVDSAFTGIKKVIDMNAKYDYTTQTYIDTGSVVMTEDDYKRIVTNWNDNFTVIDNDLYISNISAADVYVNSDWAGSDAGAEVATGKYYGINAFDKVATAYAALSSGGTIHLEDGTSTYELGTKIQIKDGKGFTITGNAPVDIRTVSMDEDTGDLYVISTDSKNNTKTVLFSGTVIPIFTLGGKDDEPDFAKIPASTMNVTNAHFGIAELDARPNATINVSGSVLTDHGGNSIIKSYFNGAINVDSSTLEAMQVTTTGYITLNDGAVLTDTWQTNLYDNGIITVNAGATFNTSKMTIGHSYGRVNPDADRTGKPATLDVNGGVLNGLATTHAYHYNTTDFFVGKDEDGLFLIRNGGTATLTHGHGLQICEKGTMSLTNGTLTVQVVTGSGSNEYAGTIRNAGAITLDTDSLITAASLTGDGTITIDATGFTGGVKKVIDLDQTSALSNVTLNAGETGAKLVLGSDGDVIVHNLSPDTLYVNSDWSDKKVGDEVTIGEGASAVTAYYGIDAFAQLADFIPAFTGGNIVAYGDGKVAATETSSGEGIEIDNSGTYNLTGTEWTNVGYLQLNAAQESLTTPVVVNIDNSNLVATKIQARRDADFVITNSHLDFENITASRGYTCIYANSTLTLNNSVYGYNHLSGTNSSEIVAGRAGFVEGQIKPTDNFGKTAVQIDGKLIAENSTLFTITGDDTVGFGVQDKGYVELTDSVLYAGAIAIGVNQSSDKKKSENTGVDVATMVLDNSIQIRQNSDNYKIEVGKNVAGALIVRNNSLIDRADAPMTVSSGSSVDISTSTVKVSALSNAGAITLDTDSLITAASLTGDGTITIDATGLAANTIAKVIDLSQSTALSNVTLNAGETGAKLVLGADGDVIVHNLSPDTLYVNSAWSTGYNAGDEIEEGSGKYYGINAFSNVDESFAYLSNGTNQTTKLADLEEIGFATGSYTGGYIYADKDVSLKPMDTANGSVVTFTNAIYLAHAVTQQAVEGEDYYVLLDDNGDEITTDNKYSKLPTFTIEQGLTIELGNNTFRAGQNVDDDIDAAKRTQSAANIVVNGTLGGRLYLASYSSALISETGVKRKATSESDVIRESATLTVKGNANAETIAAAAQKTIAELYSEAQYGAAYAQVAGGTVSLDHTVAAVGAWFTMYDRGTGETRMKNGDALFSVNASYFRVNGWLGQDALSSSISVTNNSLVEVGSFLRNLGTGNTITIDDSTVNVTTYVQNDAEITLADGGALNADSLTSSGTISVDATSSIKTTGAFENSGAITITVGGTITADTFTNGGTITIDATGFTGYADVITVNNGSAQMGGTIELIKDDGSKLELIKHANGSVSVGVVGDDIYFNSAWSTVADGAEIKVDGETKTVHKGVDAFAELGDAATTAGKTLHFTSDSASTAAFNGMFDGSELVKAQDAAADVTVSLSGASFVQQKGDLTIGSGVTLAATKLMHFAKDTTITVDGTFQAVSNAYLYAGKMIVNGSLTGDDVFLNGSGANTYEMTANGAIDVAKLRVGANATLNLAGGNVTTTEGMFVTAATGTVNVNDHATISGGLTNDGTINVADSKALSLTGAVDNSGKINLGTESTLNTADATFTNKSAGEITLNGTLSKVTGSATNEGTIEVGASTLRFLGDGNKLTNAAGGNVVISVGGQLSAAALENNGTITVDVSEAGSDYAAKVISVSGGAITGAGSFVTAGNVYANGGEYWVSDATQDVLYVNSAWKSGYSFGDQVAEGQYYGINAFGDMDEFSYKSTGANQSAKIAAVKTINLTAGAYGSSSNPYTVFYAGDNDVLLTGTGTVKVNSGRLYLMTAVAGESTCADYTANVATTTPKTFTIDSGLTLQVSMLKAGDVVDSGDARTGGVANLVINGTVNGLVFAAPYSTIDVNGKVISTADGSAMTSSSYLRPHSVINVNGSAAAGEAGSADVQFQSPVTFTDAGTLNLTDTKAKISRVRIYEAGTLAEGEKAAINLNNAYVDRYGSATLDGFFLYEGSTTKGFDISLTNKSTLDVADTTFNPNANTAITISDSTLIAGTVANSGSISVSGESLLTVGTLTGNAIVVNADANLTGSSVGGALTIDAGKTVTVGNGGLTVAALTNNGTINLTIDASALTEASYKLVDITGDGALATTGITVDGIAWATAGKTFGDYTLLQWDNDIILSKATADTSTLYVSSEYVGDYGTDLGGGKYIGINAFSSMLAAMDKAMEVNSSTIQLDSNITESLPVDYEFIISTDTLITSSATEGKYVATVISDPLAKNYDIVLGSTNNNTLTLDSNVEFFNQTRNIWTGYYGERNLTVNVNGILHGGYQIWNGSDTNVGATGILMSSGEAFILRRGKTITITGDAAQGAAAADRTAQIDASYFNLLAGTIAATDTYIKGGQLGLSNYPNYSYEGSVQVKLNNSIWMSGDFIKATTTKSGTTDHGSVLLDLVNGSTVSAKTYGVFDANTVVNVKSGSLLTFGSYVTNDGTVAIDGSTFAATTLTNNATITVSGDSLLTIGALTGTITVNADADLTGSVVGGTGDIAVSDAATLTLDGKTDVTSFGAVTNSGTIVLDGALVNLGAITNNGTINMDWQDKLTFSGFTGNAINFDMTGYTGVETATKVMDYTGAGTMDDTAYKAMISDFTADEFARTFKVIDNDLFLKAVAGPVVINNDKTIAEAVAEAAASGATTIIVEAGEFAAAEFGGEITLGGTFAGTNIVIDGGTFDDARITCGTTVTGLTSKKQYVETSGNRTVTINGGEFNGVLIAGDRIVGETAAGHADHGNDEDGVARNINLTINGGQFNKNVAGGMMLDAKNTTAYVAQYGDINLTINGGTFVKFVYGGNVSSSKSYSSNTEVYGDITVTLNASAATPISLNALYGGSYGTGKVYGSTRVVLTGDGAGLTIADQLWGGCTSDYYLINSDGSKTAVSTVLTSDGSKMSTRTLSFEGFSGTLNVKSIKMFSDVVFDGDSTVDFSGFKGTLAEVENWDIEFDSAGRVVGSGAFNNDFAGDSLNLTGLTSALEDDWVIFDNIGRFQNITEEGAGLAKINGAAAQLSTNLLEGELCGYDFAVGDNSFTLAFTEKTEEKAAQMVLRNAVLS